MKHRNYNKWWKIFVIIACTILCSSFDAIALRHSRPIATDSRIHTIVYGPNEVYKYTGFYGYQSNIEFAEDEKIESISMGVSTGWQIVSAGRRLFLKPIEADATTNMTVLTNLRTYFFELHAKEATDISDPNLVFMVKFLYPGEGDSISATRMTTADIPDLSQPEKYNFNYTVSGSDLIAPIKVFDDGKFTYMQFRSKNSPIPAIFLVYSDNTEGIINYHIAGDYIVVEQINPRFTLRAGPDIACVFNEQYLGNIANTK